VAGLGRSLMIRASGPVPTLPRGRPARQSRLHERHRARPAADLPAPVPAPAVSQLPEVPAVAAARPVPQLPRGSRYPPAVSAHLAARPPVATASRAGQHTIAAALGADTRPAWNSGEDCRAGGARRRAGRALASARQLARPRIRRAGPPLIGTDAGAPSPAPVGRVTLLCLGRRAAAAGPGRLSRGRR